MAKTEGPIYQILVVDDEPTVCKAIQMMLTHYGHVVQTAEGGETALALFDKNQFDLVITDYLMPDMKGDVLVKLIKQRRPAQRILMATAFAEDFLIHGQPSGGVDHVVAKPFSLGELRAAIAKVMG
jgi:CheY-like chemotaxis protein